MKYLAIIQCSLKLDSFDNSAIFSQRNLYLIERKNVGGSFQFVRIKGRIIKGNNSLTLTIAERRRNRPPEPSWEDSTRLRLQPRPRRCHEVSVGGGCPPGGRRQVWGYPAPVGLPHGQPGLCRVPTSTRRRHTHQGRY